MKKRTRAQLESAYDKPDPWGYQTNPADIERKRIILDVLSHYGPFEKALDIGCGEGWITTDLPAAKIYGLEASEQAKRRWPANIKNWLGFDEGFDLVMVTGALYEDYEWKTIVDIINGVGKKIVLTCNIADREFWKATESIQGQLVEIRHFDYIRSTEESFTQRLRIYRR